MLRRSRIPLIGLRKSSWCALAAGAIVFALSNVAHASDDIAVLGLEVVGEDFDEETAERAEWLTAELREYAASEESPYSLAPDGDKDLLEMKLLSGCQDEALGCMAGIGRDLGADMLLYGAMQRADDAYEVALTLIDTATPAIEGEATVAVPLERASRSEIAVRARSLYNEAAGVQPGGILIVETNAPSGTLFVEGQPRANLIDGEAQIDDLAEGIHTIEIEAEGYAPYAERVTIVAEREEVMSIALDPLEEPAGTPGRGHRIGFTATAVATGASAGAWIFFVDQWRDANNRRRDLLRGDLPSGLEHSYGEDNPDICATAASEAGGDEVESWARDVGEACDDGRRAARMNNIFGAATVVGAVAAGYFYYQGFIAPDGSVSAGDGAFRLEPRLGPDQVGAGVSLEF